MIKYLVPLFLLLGSCSLTPESENFIVSIQGNYEDFDTIYGEFTIVEKNGDFTYRNIKYQFQEAITSTNAIYFLDDVQFVGLLFNPINQELRQIVSSNTSKEGIDFNATSVGLGKKITNK